MKLLLAIFGFICLVSIIFFFDEMQRIAVEEWNKTDAEPV